MPKLRLRDATVGVATPPAASVPYHIKIQVGDGNITWSEKRSVEYVLDRGLLFADGTGDAVGFARFGDDQPVDLSFDMVFNAYTTYMGDTTSTADGTPISVIQGVASTSFAVPEGVAVPYEAADDLFGTDFITDPTVGAALQGYDTSRYGTANPDLADNCAPWCCDLVLGFNRNCAGDPTSNAYLFRYFRWESLNYDLGAGRISCSGKCQEIYAYGVDADGLAMQPV